MELDFESFSEKYNDYEEVYNQLLAKTLSHLQLNFSPILSVTLVDNETIHKINREYRQIDRPTDVISFAFQDGENREELYRDNKIVCLGDIYISYEKAEEQALEYGHSIKRELSFLFVHGLLHLLGYDHMTQEDEKIMFDLQEEILK